MPSAPVFETDIILLRPFLPEDASALHAYLSLADLAGQRYIPRDFEPFRPIPPGDAEEIIKHWSENKDGLAYAVILKAENVLIGHVTSDWSWDPHMPDIGVVVDQAHRRKGYGTQAISLVLDHLFNFTIAHNVSIGIGDWNTPAQLFATHIGFQPVGRKRDAVYIDGGFHDYLIFDLLQPEWKEKRYAVDR